MNSGSQSGILILTIARRSHPRIRNPSRNLSDSTTSIRGIIFLGRFSRDLDTAVLGGIGHGLGEASIFHPRAQRQSYLEDGSALQMIGRVDLAVVLFHDAIADRGSQTGSLAQFLGGVEGVKNAAHIMDSDSRS